MAKLGSVSDVINFFTFDPGLQEHTDTSSFYPVSREQVNIPIDEITNKRNKQILASVDVAALAYLLWNFPTPKIEVNGLDKWYLVEAPRLHVDSFLQPMRLPSRCEQVEILKPITDPPTVQDAPKRNKIAVFPSPKKTNYNTNNYFNNIENQDLMQPPLDALIFESNFECGNLRRVDLIAGTCGSISPEEIITEEYELTLRADPIASGREFWFFFRIQINNIENKKKKYKFTFNNYNKGIAAFQAGYRPVAF
eukprot:gene15195-32196_t